MEDLTNYRRSYEKSELGDSGLPDEPMALFTKWFREAEDNNPEAIEVNAMSISTIGRDGFPKTRVVLLKQYDTEGFVFFTNYHSEKGKAIEDNPQVCLSFFWPWMERQVIIKGVAKKTTHEVSSEYFKTRPKGSQFGAAVSHQSEVIASREVLEQRLKSLEQEYAHTEIPKPEDWGGYIIVPQQLEFWQGRRNRLHDRIRYTPYLDRWVKERLSP